MHPSLNSFEDFNAGFSEIKGMLARAVRGEGSKKDGVKVTELQFGTGVEGRTEAGTYAYYRFVLDEVVETRIVVRALSGNPDLYVSTSTTRPSHDEYTWKSTRAGTDVVVIKPDDPAAVDGAYGQLHPPASRSCGHSPTPHPFPPPAPFIPTGTTLVCTATRAPQPRTRLSHFTYP